MEDKNKEIIALNDYEHVCLRPTMYVGSCAKSEYKMPIINGEGLIEYHDKRIVVGFWKLFLEIFDNAIDEGKRCKGKMKRINIKLNTNENSISVQDTGGGFYLGTEMNEKTGQNNIQTAFTSLRAGSNFVRNIDDSNLIGTNGVGASIVNMLSDEFSVETTTKDYNHYCVWNRFEKKSSGTRKTLKSDEIGTTVKFKPKVDLFVDEKWDVELLKFIISTKQFILRETEDELSNLKINFYVDEKKININYKLVPDNSIVVKTKLGLVAIFDKYENSDFTGFVNGARCQGIFQKIIHDKINSYFDYSLAHHYYNSMIIMNLHPSLVQFGDQNKTRFETARVLIEGDIEKAFNNKINTKFLNSSLYKRIKKRVDDKLFSDEIKKIKKSQKESKVKISKKYTSATKKLKTLYICEGLSAGGSLLQKRDSFTEGVYTLKGKIKNCRDIRDLSSNQEVIDLMTILKLKIDSKSDWSPSYDEIVIATDYDPDGVGHICSLLINLFYKWFPSVVENNHLYLLETPLLSVENGKTKDYYYNLKDVNLDDIKGKKRYLKGLGSLTLKDWEYVMNNKKFIRFKADEKAEQMLEMAFGKDSQKRKNWLKR